LIKKVKYSEVWIQDAMFEEKNSSQNQYQKTDSPSCWAEDALRLGLVKRP